LFRDEANNKKDYLKKIDWNDTELTCSFTFNLEDLYKATQIVSVGFLSFVGKFI